MEANSTTLTNLFDSLAVLGRVKQEAAEEELPNQPPAAERTPAESPEYNGSVSQ